MRELVKIRWHIENETFKALNEQCHSKYCFVRGEKMAALEDHRSLAIFYDLYYQSCIAKTGVLCHPWQITVARMKPW